MTANDGDNATRPKDSAWPGLNCTQRMLGYAGGARRHVTHHGDRGHRAVKQAL